MTSKLVLGTAQLGMPYGINNTHGQPDKQEAFAILDLAWKNGIDTFDTAPAYGSAEAVLGEWLRSRSLTGPARVITKAARYGEDLVTQVRQSLLALGTERLYGLLLHSVDEMGNEDTVRELRRAKEKGLALNIGTITYTPEEANEALGKGFDFIQVPYNVFDRRLDASGFFRRAKKHSVTVFARSPSLQGLLLMSPDNIPPYLSHARPLVGQFRDIADSSGLKPIEAAMMFVLAHRDIDHVVFGVERAWQLEQIIGASKLKVNAQCLTRLQEAFADVDISIINPSLWQKG